MKELVEDLSGIAVTFFKSAKAKRINISLKPFAGVRVSVPSSVSFKQAKTATQKRMGWIQSQVSKMKRVEDQYTVFTSNTKFQTRSHSLVLKRVDAEALRSFVANSKITVSIPNTLNIADAVVQTEIRTAIVRALRKEAKDYLPERVAILAAKHNFTYKNTAIKNAKTRWGSCSFENNINLNLHLMRLPEHLIDYVILHELVHTKVKNHSKDFWQLLQLVSGNAKGLDKEVKCYSTHIY